MVPARTASPPSTTPRFESIDEARSWVTGTGPVIALEIDGDARAYPLAVLTWHEIVNDTVGDVPVIVTFCPLCHTALVFERTLDGTVHDFGVSGNLRSPTWSCTTARPRRGGSRPRARASSASSPAPSSSSCPASSSGSTSSPRPILRASCSAATPASRRDYGRNPYVGYDTIDQQPFLFDGVTDGRLRPRSAWSRSASRTASAPISIPYSELRQVGAVNLDFEGRPTVVLWAPGAAPRSIVPTSTRARTWAPRGVFSAVVDGQTLTFDRDGDEDAPITDVETGSTWDITGRATRRTAGRHRRSSRSTTATTSGSPGPPSCPHTDIWTTEGVLLALGRGGCLMSEARDTRDRIGLGLPRPPRVEPSERRVRVIVDGTVIADSRRAVRVLETSHPPAWYLPPEDVRMDLLRPTERRTACEFKGEASYFHGSSGGGSVVRLPGPMPGRCRATRRSRATSRSTPGGWTRPGSMTIGSRPRPATSTVAGSRPTMSGPVQGRPGHPRLVASRRATSRAVGLAPGGRPHQTPPFRSRDSPAVRGPVVPRWGAQTVRGSADSWAEHPIATPFHCTALVVRNPSPSRMGVEQVTRTFCPVARSAPSSRPRHRVSSSSTGRARSAWSGPRMPVALVALPAARPPRGGT